MGTRGLSRNRLTRARLPLSPLPTAQIRTRSHRRPSRTWRPPERVPDVVQTDPLTARSHDQSEVQSTQSSVAGEARDGTGAGTSVGRWRCARIRAAAADASSTATRRSRPPHPGHASTSMAKTRRIRLELEAPPGLEPGMGVLQTGPGRTYWCFVLLSGRPYPSAVPGVWAVTTLSRRSVPISTGIARQFVMGSQHSPQLPRWRLYCLS